MKIRHRFTREVLWEDDSQSMRETFKAALKHGADLRYADLTVSGLSGLDLSGLDLTGCDLRYSNLRGCDLRCSSLLRANLRHCDLRDVDFRGSDLRRANLTGAELHRCVLDGCDLAGAVGIIALGSPNGWTAHAWLRDGWLSIRIGCQERRLAEAREHWSASHEAWELRREVRAAVEYAATVAEARGWPTEEPLEDED